MVSPLNDENLPSSINKELQQAYKAEEEYWKQRSIQLWLSVKDKNSDDFYAITCKYNVYYKIISKLLTQRFQPLMEKTCV